MLHFHPVVSHRRLASLMANVAAAAALVACGGGGSSTTPTTAAPTPAPAPAPAPAPTPAPASSGLNGTLYGPVAVQVTLQNNLADDLVVALPAAGTDAYNAAPFTFATLQATGSAYAVTVKAKPAGQTCAVYQRATGTVPAAGTGVKVGCEFTDEHLVRSADNSVRGSYFDSGAPVVGGSQEPIGTGSENYGEGRFVAFVSSTTGLTSTSGSTGGFRQIYWRDRLTGTNTLVSASAAGVPGNNDSVAPAISADGLTVVFESYANNLVAGDANGVRDVFVWSATHPELGARRISVGPGGAEANSESFEPVVSGDGRVVAFSSGASNLAPGVSGTSTINVYRRDLIAGTNTLISADGSGLGVGGSKPALSEDGSRLAFYSFASTLVAGDTNGLWDIFVFDAGTGRNTRVSLTSTGGERDQGSESASRVVAPAISGNGRFVAFATTATNMVPGDTNGLQDVFVVDTQNGGVVRASTGVSGAQGNADSPMGQGERVSLSYDGSWVGFSTFASNLGAGASGVGTALLRNVVTGQTIALTDRTTGSVGPVAISRTARYGVFGTSNPLDDRFASSGLFAHFTGLGFAWSWSID